MPEIRHATTDDIPRIVELAHRALGWRGDESDAAFFRWKHFDNPFGASMLHIAVDRDRVIGLRAFLRWQLRAPNGAGLSAVRAVDTATDPDWQGQGIFNSLTRHAVEKLRSEGVALIFNTPNERSLPGYLKMGWSTVGRLPISMMPCHLRSLDRLVSARRAAAASRSSVETPVGYAAPDALSDPSELAQLLAARRPDDRIVTASNTTHLAWRYGHRPLHYRVIFRSSSPADGLVVFRLRRRGRAVEAVVCDVILPEPAPQIARLLMRRIARETDATYLLRLGGPLLSRDPFARVPRTGPVLACRRLDNEPVAPLHEWGFVLGDIELF